MRWTRFRIITILVCCVFVAPIICIPVLLIYWNIIDRMDRDSPVLAGRLPPKGKLETGSTTI
jgi:hypothetical protein